jgi:hypothetical protein
VKSATLKVYPGFPHGMPTTHADTINADLRDKGLRSCFPALLDEREQLWGWPDSGVRPIASLNLSATS